MTNEPTFLERVLNSEPAKRGIAGVAAGLLIAVVTEAIWPSS